MAPAYRNTHTRYVSAAIHYTVKGKLQAHANAANKTLHAFLVDHLTEWARVTPVPERQALPPHDANKANLTETIILELDLDMAERLQWNARQLRERSGKSMPPATLARQIVAEECGVATGIRDAIAAQCVADYWDGIGFEGRKTHRSATHVVWRCQLKMTFEQKVALAAQARQRNQTQVQFVRETLDAYLLPYATRKEREMAELGMA